MISIFVSSCNTRFCLDTSADDVVILDSSSEKKISYHLIFKNVVFLNNRKCKSFVNDVIKCMSHEDIEMITVFDKHGKKVLAVDLSVYNKNQCFRKVIVTLNLNYDPLSSHKVQNYTLYFYKNQTIRLRLRCTLLFNFRAFLHVLIFLINSVSIVSCSLFPCQF